MNCSARIDRKASLRLGLGVGLAFGLSACAGGLGGTTYGTGVSQEEALINDLQNLAAVSSTQTGAKIDYSSRPGLVVPPQGKQLPKPLDKSKAGQMLASNDWPQDPDLLRKAYHERMSNMNDTERKELLQAIRRLPPEQRAYIIKNDPRSTAFTNQIKEPSYDKGLPSAGEVKEYDRQVRERLAAIRATNSKSTSKYERKYLTQPPKKYRQHSPEIQRELDKVAVEGQEKEKSGNVFKKLWPF